MAKEWFTYKDRYAGNNTDAQEFRQKWGTSTSENTIKLFIDGIEIPSYSDYSYVDTKNYFKEPERSALGVINNLNSYATFITPKIRFSFKSMPISAYRVIMKLIKERNEFSVTAYDPVEDEYVTRMMYFAPKDYPDLFTKGYETLRANNEEFELIGTNADVKVLSLVYNSNTIDYKTSFLNFYYGQGIRIGDYETGYENNDDPTTWTNPGFTFKEWNTRSDGTGDTYLTGQTDIHFTTNVTLFAIWNSNNKYVVSFDYQAGSGEYIGDTTLNKEVLLNEPYGTLPNVVSKNGYVFGGWYTRPDGQGVQITASSTFQAEHNQTLYVHWIGTQNTISYDNNGGSGSINSQTARTGEDVTVSTNAEEGQIFTKAGYQNMYWYRMNGDSEDKFADLGATVKCPPYSVVLYPKWQQRYNLTYHKNDGSSTDTTFVSYVAKEYTPYEGFVREGYIFAGWYTDTAFTMYQSFPIDVKENIDLYARWEAEE